MKNSDSHDYLAWFLGPKAENGKFLETQISDIVRDYSHWRKNYFPDDPILITQQLRNRQEENRTTLEGRLSELLASLRRNFPFYSPRYIAHELSDTLMPATLGYIAGMLYNPNNVTPEAAPVTTELEIEVTSEILEMLGYRAPPSLPPLDADPDSYYAEWSKIEFGWAHLASGGTVANIEALWVARQIKYFPLAVKELAVDQQFDLGLKLPNDTVLSIREVDDYQLLLLRPNESIFLFQKLVATLARLGKITNPSRYVSDTWRLLDGCEFATSKGFGLAFHTHKPKILVSTSQHYSISKAANVLGIGQSNIIPIRMDSKFRMDVGHLRSVLINDILARRDVPLCVIATVGTTEEGAVDPIHDIVDLRAELEKSHGLSFWLHVDAAWGGFIRSLFRLSELEETEAVCGSVARALRIMHPKIFPKSGTSELHDWHLQLAPFLSKRIAEVDQHILDKQRGAAELGNGEAATKENPKFSEPPGASIATTVTRTSTPHKDASERGKESGRQPSGRKEPFGEADTRRFIESVCNDLQKMSTALLNGEHRDYRRSLKRLLYRFDGRRSYGEPAEYLPGVRSWLERANEDGSSLFAITDWLLDYVSERIVVDRPVQVNWPPKEIAMAFLAFPKAESITVDPHKMGYAPYPAGCIAFRNDLVRSFILHQAPYITSAERRTVHVPPRYVVVDNSGQRRIVTESFSPFILEGSRPGAAATGLWLAMKCVPYTPRGHGVIARSALISAKLLHELLVKTNQQHAVDPDSCPAYFVPLLEYGPDTNLVTLTVSPKIFCSLSNMNKLTTRVYDNFSIQAELGERAHSYSQPFFLSKTTMFSSHYPVGMLKPFFQRAGLSKSVAQQYQRDGMVVLRATVMNPYLSAARQLVDQDFCKLFVTELVKAAEAACIELFGAKR